MSIEIKLDKGKKIFFLSDIHLGVPNRDSSFDREKLVLNFLNKIKPECQYLFLCGDVFDFWFEWEKVIPKGFIRFLGKLAEFQDDGIQVYFFKGNHDMWIKDYFEKELSIKVFDAPMEFTINNKIFFIGHGDGLGPSDHGFKFMKLMFKNKIAQWLFAKLIHPDLAIKIADYFSKGSRAANGERDKIYLGDDKEWINIFCKEKLKQKHYDFFIFGHRHIPLDIKLSQNSRYINLGDWISEFTYASFDGEELELKKLKDKQ